MQTLCQQTRIAVCVLLLSALSTTGCRGPWSGDWKFADMFDVDMSPWSEDEPEAETPVRLVGSWTDTVLYQTGKSPQRGFGGRLIFYGKDTEQPVLVDGQLVVYAFDETNREPTDNKPTRRYVFPPDQVSRRMSRSELGASYSFWLPWDEVGGPQTEVSLIARFEPKDGAVVVGEQTKHLLPGELKSATGIAAGVPKLPDGIPMRPAAPQLSPPAAQADPQVQLAGYTAPADELPRRGMLTTSISLPENFRVRGGGSPPSVQTGTTLTAGPASVPQPAAVSHRSPTTRVLQPMPVAFPAFMAPQQSSLGNGFVAPLGQQHFAPQPMPNAVSQIAAPPAAPIMSSQPTLAPASGWPTVNSPSAAGAAGPATTR